MKKKRETSELKQLFQSIPGLLGKEIMGVKVFNATLYVESLEGEKELTIDSFKESHSEFIDVIARQIGVTKESILTTDEAGDVYMHIMLSVAFLEYFNVGFKVWSNARMIELMVDGISMSDNFIIGNTIKRFGVDQLKEMLGQ
ncbi:MAG: hypothetical protein AB7G87_10910 [Clostridia bacterium]